VLSKEQCKAGSGQGYHEAPGRVKHGEAAAQLPEAFGMQVYHLVKIEQF